MIILNTLCLFIYCIICWYLIKFIKGIKNSDKIIVRALFYGLLVFFCIGDNLLGNIFYYYNVWKVGGVKTYGVAAGVDGFLVEPKGYMAYTFNDLLFSKNYKYIEQKVNNDGYYRKRGSATWYLNLANGYYELSVGAKGDATCAQDALFEKEEKCIRCIKVDAPRSKYLVKLNDRVEYSLDLLFGKIINVNVDSAQIIDTSNGRVLSDISIVRYTGGWIRRSMFNRDVKSYPENKILEYMVAETVPMVLTNN